MRRLLLALAVSTPLIGLGGASAEAFGCCDGWGYAPYYIYYPRTNCYVYIGHHRPSRYRRRRCEGSGYRHHWGWLHW